MEYQEYKTLLAADLYRIEGKSGFNAGLKEYFTGEGWKYIFHFRTCQFLKQRKILKIFLYPLFRLKLRQIGFKLGISIPVATQIGPGLYIAHFGGIIVNSRVKIGRNVNISQGVTIGTSNRGKSAGTPIIGDNVYLGPGCKVFGKVSIANNAVIGANATVNFDVKTCAVVAPTAGRIISYKGSSGIVNHQVSG
ncbi:serine O-acetyltransferase [Vibrio europaeus]|uniref:serine O-acetyltransferase n=1 Tax=Vibrio europaeus TaxID=300876 RepID=UPI00148C8F0D|nr:serine acetyltransferase [Vibrio europaeus]MDC5819333.1 serine acetyltransferase [Vibrio europaeus]MDC5842302.1 serine acetyltransferase [Vibrio europaeus]MDC5855612.1 serine acetyltransferase [Vibrio europaeus]MDC5872114.1 serine acetyltransferase [Vibrio europaeus]NOH24996.1 serine acetyltransferase [Vibrio europaeus]